MVVTNRRRRALAVGVVLVALIAVTVTSELADTGGDRTRPAAAGDGVAAPSPGHGTTGGADHPAGDPPVIAPGRPGESARTIPGGQVAPAPVRYNSVDVWFVRMMIPHHSQALRMAALAPQRASDPQIRALAERVRAGQLAEIQALRGWLQERHLDPEDPRDGHDHASMPGMQSDAAMRRLTEARGAEFDRMFVEMMTDHHQGAITMATELLRVGIDETAQQLANSIAVEQGVEIDRMRELRRRVPGSGEPA